MQNVECLLWCFISKPNSIPERNRRFRVINNLDIDNDLKQQLIIELKRDRLRVSLENALDTILRQQKVKSKAKPRAKKH
jgi:hypothetical protein